MMKSETLFIVGSVARRNEIVPQYLYGNYRTDDVNEVQSCVITTDIALSMNNTHISPSVP